MKLAPSIHLIWELGKSKNKCINFTVNALLALEEKNTLKKISVYTGKQDVMFDSYWWMQIGHLDRHVGIFDSILRKTLDTVHQNLAKSKYLVDLV